MHKSQLSLHTKLSAVFILLLFATSVLYSSPRKYPGLFPAKLQIGLFEVNNIAFTGNKRITEQELLGAISSRVSARNTVHQILQYYYENISRVKYGALILPPQLMPAMKSSILRMAHEIQYFDERRAVEDAVMLSDYYNQFGYHNAFVTFDFKPDSSTRKNVLVFNIIENEVSNLSIVTILGIDSVDAGVLNLIKEKKIIQTGKPFSEKNIMYQTHFIYKVLQDNGYYFASYTTPTVTKDTVKLQDSVTITFSPGKRQKISSITYVDSTKGQKLVTNVMKDKLCEFKTGEWYSANKIDKTRNNLFSLGTFDIVSIDTSSIFNKHTDTSLAYKIFTQYRKQQEFGGGLYVNQTAVQRLSNLGVELSYLNRNIGGIAQSVNLFSRLEMIDLSSAIRSTGHAEFEVQFGGSYAQPLLWTIDQAKIGLSSQLLYSISKINQTLRLSTISFLMRFPARLPSWTYFNQFSIDFLVEWQTPMELDSARTKALKMATTLADSNLTIQSFKTYDVLDKYRSKNAFSPTAMIITASITGDTRNDLFTPSAGYYTTLSLDSYVGIGIAKFIRPQLTHYSFKSLNESTVFAWKARGGYIFWFDEANSYIPLERQFFAGGANSVRGWKSRRLRIPQPTGKEFPSGTLDFSQDYTGSRTILEGTFEVRWKLGRPKNMSSIVADIAEQIVLSGFVDWGNTYHWIAYDQTYKLLDYFTNIAISSGLGLGILTPVGPLRLDVSWPLYDPAKVSPIKLGNYEFHIGVGHAF